MEKAVRSSNLEAAPETPPPDLGLVAPILLVPAPSTSADGIALEGQLVSVTVHPDDDPIQASFTIRKPT